MLDVLVSDPSIDRLVDHLKTECLTSSLNGIEKSFAKEVESKIRADGLNQDKYRPRMRYTLEVDIYGFAKAIEDYMLKLFKLNKDSKN